MPRAVPGFIAVAVCVASCGDNLGPPATNATADAAPEDQPLIFVGSWGGLGTDPGLFVEPSSVELASDGVVIVAGHEDRVQRFTRDGQLLDIFGTPGAGDAQFNHPHGLAVDRDRGDLIYVGDQENGRVQVFDRDARFVRQWGDEFFAHIHDVGIDRASGDIFVGDLEFHTLRKFNSEGVLLATVGGPGTDAGKFNQVWGVSTDSEGFVYVADTGNRRLQKLDRDGTFVAQWSSYDGVAFRKPTGVFVDGRDVIYVTDSLAEHVVLLDPGGAVLDVWDLRAIVGRRTEPEDIVIDAAGEHIYVAEVFEHSVLHFRRR